MYLRTLDPYGDHSTPQGVTLPVSGNTFLLLTVIGDGLDDTDVVKLVPFGLLTNCSLAGIAMSLSTSSLPTELTFTSDPHGVEAVDANVFHVCIQFRGLGEFQPMRNTTRSLFSAGVQPSNLPIVLFIGHVFFLNPWFVSLY